MTDIFKRLLKNSRDRAQEELKLLDYEEYVRTMNTINALSSKVVSRGEDQLAIVSDIETVIVSHTLRLLNQRRN